MGVPGMVDRRGRVLNAPQLGWRDVQIRSGLAERTGLPVHVENSGAACALAHIWLGPGEGGNGVRDFVYVTVSDGVGTGVVVNGELVRGHGDEIAEDRKSTRLNSSHLGISYAVFCLKKKRKKH